MSHGFPFLKVLTGAMLLVLAAQAQAQDQGERRRGSDRSGQDDGGRRGNFDPAQMREREMSRLKEDLGASEDEWKVLQPKLDKVMSARRDTWSGFGGFSGRGRGDDRDRSRNSDQPESKVAAAQRELRTTLDNKSASADDISKKLKTYREARDKARADLQAAQKSLREVVTQRQEATLVLRGMLE